MTARRARGSVLIVEDEAYVRASLADMLREREFDVAECASAEDALLTIRRTPVDLVLTDLRMPGMGGLELVARVREAAPDVPIVVLTGFGTVASAVECLRAGAADYVLKPADPEALEVTIARAIDSQALRREVAYLRHDAEHEPVGHSSAWKKTIALVEAAARDDATILFLGESGSGKDILAKLVHQRSARHSGPFVRVNCAAIPIEMWESEFFGHRKGAFTGASADRAGRFKLAHGGTLFLDEVGAMPLASQAKTLRALEDGEITRLGDERPMRVDVRIVAATNSDLEAEVARGAFRQDLYWRLNVVRIVVPALRDRLEDIPLLVERLLGDLCARRGRPVPEVSGVALEAAKAYSWPGNVRELRNVVERALLTSPGPILESLDVTPTPLSARDQGVDGDLELRSALGRRERELIVEALRRAGGVKKDAARMLGIDQRNLAYYLKKNGLAEDG
ncbi:MAG: sigma-54 dependent transcriptional regulator [Acidobacteriota bacterium]